MKLPINMRDYIIATHNRGTKFIDWAGFEPEPVEVAIAVEEHRWFWKPETVRLILVAESHVYTTEHDFSYHLDVDKMKSLLDGTHFVQGHNQPAPIREYVGLIYCLAYGDKTLLLPDSNPEIQHDDGTRKLSARGTPQYWGQVFSPLAGVTSLGFEWKIKILEGLYRKGIWLLDASVHAIYRGEGKKVKDKDQLHVQWWDGYGKHIMQPGNQAHVWVIGKGVYKALTSIRNDFAQMVSGCISQPNARLTNEERAKEMEPLLELAASLPNNNKDGKANIVI